MLKCATDSLNIWDSETFEIQEIAVFPVGQKTPQLLRYILTIYTSKQSQLHQSHRMF